MPFKLQVENTPEELLSQISESKINFDEGNWRQVSNEAKVINHLKKIGIYV